MNYTRVIFCTLVTSGIGAFFGFASAELTRDSVGRYRYQSPAYQQLYQRDLLVIGAGLGALVGLGQECIRELKDKRDRELDGEEENEL